MKTLGMMGVALVGAVLLNLSYISWMNGYGWDWAHGFPLGWGGAGLGAMVTFFHEIGHTVPAWFYGYVTFPSFDLTYGGGMAWMMTDQTIPVFLFMNGALLYAAWYFKKHRGLTALLILYAFFNFATGFTDFHHAVIDFAGPAAEILFASFFLIRAWLDIAPRGRTERFLNALIGWGMMAHACLTGFGLLHNNAMRENYYNQKGTHGFGDFDKIADNIGVSFNGVVTGWMVLAFAGMILPILLWIGTEFRDHYEDRA